MSRCVTQQNLLILAEDFYVTGSYNILGDQLSKPNWACSACGMYSGRKESVVRHIRNKNVHNGYASVIPFVDSLIARQSGFYAGQHEGRKNLFRHLDTGFELFQKALPENLAEKLAEPILNFNLNHRTLQLQFMIFLVVSLPKICADDVTRVKR